MYHNHKWTCSQDFQSAIKVCALCHHVDNSHKALNSFIRSLGPDYEINCWNYAFDKLSMSNMKLILP